MQKNYLFLNQKHSSSFFVIRTMEKTPKSMRLQIGIFGRTNVGKSSFLNMIAGQDAAMTSPEPGTTTDVVEKSMELLPVGPVTFLDTAGIDDRSTLGELRIGRSEKILDRAEIVILLVEPDIWTDYEEKAVEKIKSRKIPFIIAINKIDRSEPAKEFIDQLGRKAKYVLACSSIDEMKRDQYLTELKEAILGVTPDSFIRPMPLIGDLISPGSFNVLIVPIDSEAPKGRIILPQVQTIRDILDTDAVSVVTKENEYPDVIKKLMKVQKPDLVVCDSQVVMKMVEDTPPEVKCTTFSILFSRFKGDLNQEVRGAAAIDNLKKGDRILIAEACSHHPNEDDIGRVKIPRWLGEYLGRDVQIEHYAGRDYPEDVSKYKAIIHCGGCMITRNEKLVRIEKAAKAGVPITNYGILISLLHGVLRRVLEPFPEALEIFDNYGKE